MLLTACGGDGEICEHKDTEPDLVCDKCGEALPDPNLDGKICYTVTVLDALGEPMPNIIVQIFDGEAQIAAKMTNNVGVAACSKDHPVDAGKSPFTVKLVSPDGKALSYDEQAAIISDGKEEITVSLFKTTADLMTEALYLGGSDDPTNAHVLSDGKYRVELKSGENYFVFVPTVRGQYKLSAESPSGFTMGYFGSPHFVQQSNIASTDGTGEVFLDGGALFFNIRAFNVGDDYYSSSRYVFRVDSETACEAFINVKCVDKNLPLSKEEMPWEEYLLPSDPAPFTPSFTVESVSELTSVSVTDPAFTAVYNPEDGFYHAGTADGPVIFVKLTVDSDYIAAFKTIMETTQFSTYVFDGEGNLVAKKNYHTMMQKYIDASGELGIYPLTAPLKEAITTIGDSWGWYKDGGANNIFTGKVTSPVVAENAYLFACCYYEEQ